jgi:putative Mg2+ transporter-C (MgtC) family protein
MNFVDIGQLQSLGLVALAMLLGAALGFEREQANKPAGLRTHMMVSGAAALLITLGNALVTLRLLKFLQTRLTE